MKISGFLQGSGKIGEIVLAKCAGATIARAYNGTVANPSTSAQVDNRAKLKLISQLSAALAPVIAMPKVGMSSSRNQFSKRNYRFLSAADGVAQVSYENVQLTSGNAGIPGINVVRVANESLTLNLAENAGSLVDAMVWIVFRKNGEGSLQLMDEKVIEEAGENGNFPAVFDYISGELVIYAYGIKTSGASASASFGDMQLQSALDIARLVAVRSVSTSDLIFTATRGVTLRSDENNVTPVPDGKARVFVTANGSGTVSGAGTFDIGSSVTVVATPTSPATFTGWRKNGTQNYLSTNASYTFTLAETTDLIADFAAPGGGGEEDDH